MKILASILCCCLPLKHLHLNSAYGNRIHPLTGQLKFHSGIDLKARNDTVFAVSGGLGIGRHSGMLPSIADWEHTSTDVHMDGGMDVNPMFRVVSSSHICTDALLSRRTDPYL